MNWGYWLYFNMHHETCECQGLTGCGRKVGDGEKQANIQKFSINAFPVIFVHYIHILN